MAQRLVLRIAIREFQRVGSWKTKRDEALNLGLPIGEGGNRFVLREDCATRVYPLTF